MSEYCINCESSAKRIAELEATIEQLTCCGTCFHCNTQDQPECEEARPDWVQVQLSQRKCHFTPSRWTNDAPADDRDGGLRT